MEKGQFMGAKKGSKKATSYGSMGGSMSGSMEYTKGNRKRLAEKMKAEEDYWASLAGPVTVRYAEPRGLK